MRTIVNRLSQSDSAEAWKQVMTYFFNIGGFGQAMIA